VHDRTIQFKAIDLEGRMFDMFEMTKPETAKLAGDCRPSYSVVDGLCIDCGGFLAAVDLVYRGAAARSSLYYLTINAGKLAFKAFDQSRDLFLFLRNRKGQVAKFDRNSPLRS